MSFSQSKPAEEKHIPIPVIDNDDLDLLIRSLRSHIPSAGPENGENQQKIKNLVKQLTDLSGENPSPERSLKIHTEVMKTYLIDGFVEQRKKIKKGEPSIRTSLSVALEEFQMNSQSRLFLGYVPSSTKREDILETQIMHSVCSPAEARELVTACYARAKKAFVAGLIDPQAMSDAQRIYQNAKRFAIEM